jgi:hypothetical protein
MEKRIDTLADLLEELLTFKGDPKKTAVLLFDGAQTAGLSVQVASHSSAPNKFEMLFQKRLDREFVVAGILRRKTDADEDIKTLVDKIDRLRRDLTSRMEARDQCDTMLAMIEKAAKNNKD